MVRSTFRRKRVYRKKKTQGAKQIASKALKMVKSVVRKEEIKYCEYAANFTQGTTFTGGHWTIIPQGTGINSRIGNKVTLSGLSLRYYTYRHPSSITVNVRFVVVMDMQTVSDDVTPQWTDVFTQSSIVSLRNLDTNAKRFKILHDKSYQFSESQVGIPTRQYWIPLKGTTVLYNGTANTDIQKNAIYVLTLSDDNTNQPAINYYMRLYFTDL